MNFIHKSISTPNNSYFLFYQTAIKTNNGETSDSSVDITNNRDNEFSYVKFPHL